MQRDWQLISTCKMNYQRPGLECSGNLHASLGDVICALEISMTNTRENELLEQECHCATGQGSTKVEFKVNWTSKPDKLCVYIFLIRRPVGWSARARKAAGSVLIRWGAWVCVHQQTRDSWSQVGILKRSTLFSRMFKFSVLLHHASVTTIQFLIITESKLS